MESYCVGEQLSFSHVQAEPYAHPSVAVPFIVLGDISSTDNAAYIQPVQREQQKTLNVHTDFELDEIPTRDPDAPPSRKRLAAASKQVHRKPKPQRPKMHNQSSPPRGISVITKTPTTNASENIQHSSPHVFKFERKVKPQRPKPHIQPSPPRGISVIMRTPTRNASENIQHSSPHVFKFEKEIKPNRPIPYIQSSPPRGISVVAKTPTRNASENIQHSSPHVLKFDREVKSNRPKPFTESSPKRDIRVMSKVPTRNASGNIQHSSPHVFKFEKEVKPHRPEPYIESIPLTRVDATANRQLQIPTRDISVVSKTAGRVIALHSRELSELLLDDILLDTVMELNRIEQKLNRDEEFAFELRKAADVLHALAESTSRESEIYNRWFGSDMVHTVSSSNDKHVASTSEIASSNRFRVEQPRDLESPSLLMYEDESDIHSCPWKIQLSKKAIVEAINYRDRRVHFKAYSESSLLGQDLSAAQIYELWSDTILDEVCQEAFKEITVAMDDCVDSLYKQEFGITPTTVENG